MPTQATLSAVFGHAGDELSDIEDDELATSAPKPSKRPEDSESKVNDVESEDEPDDPPPKRINRNRALPLKKIAFESQLEDDNDAKSLRRRQSSIALADELEKVADNAGRLSSMGRDTNDSDSTKKNVNLPSKDSKSVLPSKASTAKTPARSVLSREYSPASNKATIPLTEDSVDILEDEPQPPQGAVRSGSPVVPATSTKPGRSGKASRAKPGDVLGKPVDQAPHNGLHPVPLGTGLSIRTLLMLLGYFLDWV